MIQKIVARDIEPGLTTKQMGTLFDEITHFRVDDEKQRERINTTKQKVLVLRLGNGEFAEEIHNPPGLEFLFDGFEFYV
jgi:hypothetical protein